MKRIIKLNLNKVIVFDAHSDVSIALFNNCESIVNHDMVKYFLNKLNLSDFVLVSPDLGAPVGDINRYRSFALSLCGREGTRTPGPKYFLIFQPYLIFFRFF